MPTLGTTLTINRPNRRSLLRLLGGVQVSTARSLYPDLYRSITPLYPSITLSLYPSITLSLRYSIPLPLYHSTALLLDRSVIIEPTYCILGLLYILMLVISTLEDSFIDRRAINEVTEI